MPILSQGSQVYALVPTVADPAELEVLAIACATAFNPGGSPADQIETTCLEESDRSYLPGLRTPGAASLTLNFDPREPSHVRLFELSQMNPSPVLDWALGWSDGKDIPPTVAVAGDAFELPATRTWFAYQGYLSDVPFDLAANTVVTSTVTIQRSGAASLIPKA